MEESVLIDDAQNRKRIIGKETTWLKGDFLNTERTRKFLGF